MSRLPLASGCLFPGTTSFEERLRQQHVHLRRTSIQTVQVNLGRLCNQACRHCHIEAGPQRKEIMQQRTAELAVEFVLACGVKTVELTGGAPELNPFFRFLVSECRRLGLHVIDRSNLTVFFEPGMVDLPEFLAENQVEIAASLPCYTREYVDLQRGEGVFQKSIQAIERLNCLGYGGAGTGLALNLVYNPLGADLPCNQASLEADYREQLADQFSITFNHLYVLANMPLGRFAHGLQNHGELDGYTALLAGKFNPDVLANLMCLSQVSLSWDGYFYDCDFNLAAGLSLGNGRPFHLGGQPPDHIAAQLIDLPVHTGTHCYGCTAGCGSSCQGSLR